MSPGPGTAAGVYRPWRLLCQFRSTNGPGRAGRNKGDGTYAVGNLALNRFTDAPSLAPDDRPIDLVHLARTTMGDRSLEREVLQLFDRQSTLLIARMRSAATGNVATLAHTLKGSARGIGAWRVARAAEAWNLRAQSDAATSPRRSSGSPPRPTRRAP